MSSRDAFSTQLWQANPAAAGFRVDEDGRPRCPDCDALFTEMRRQVEPVVSGPTEAIVHRPIGRVIYVCAREHYWAINDDGVMEKPREVELEALPKSPWS